MTIPTRALSIRQPYCHHILFDGKDVENRSWSTMYRGPVLIHASKGFDADDRDLIKRYEMPLGGIVGIMTITDCVESMDSPWFYGPFGFVIRDARPLSLIPCRGTIRPPFWVAPDAVIDEVAYQLREGAP